MNKNYSIICTECRSENFTDDLDKNERVVLNCFNCDNEIGEVIPKFYLFIEFIFFLLNLSIFLLIIGISGYFFENYPDWKFSSGFVFCFTLMMASVALHEFFHAFFAYMFGDYTVFSSGYLRLNIFKYFDNFGSLIFPLILFCFIGMFFPGAAVFISTNNIKNRFSLFIVDIAGVFSQILFIFLIIILLTSNSLNFSNDFTALLHGAAFVQVILLVFNLLPIPGYDGWNAIFAIVSRKIGDTLSKFLYLPISIGFVVSVIVFGMFNDFLEVLISFIFSICNILGLDKELIFEGFSYLKIIDQDTLKLLKDRVLNLFF